MSTVASPGSRAERPAEADGRPDACADGRTDAPPVELRASQAADGSRGTADTNGAERRKGQRRRLYRGCWICGQLGHDMKDCWIAEHLQAGGESWASLRAQFDPRRSGER